MSLGRAERAVKRKKFRGLRDVAGMMSWYVLIEGRWQLGKRGS